LISADDIQRTIIQNKSLETLAINVTRQEIMVAISNDSFESIKQIMMEFRMELCPVVNEKYEIIKVYFWEDIIKIENLDS
jgi:predicted transcriptional regulator